ncbi:alpha/beta hydrolase [Pseudonocardia xinjiangensis]|uniref:Alpha/beta hydrolase n=1 Tax=Pseudonocardia xinjiangensis TaxID=75289 RepID=A0ABX1RGA1_9PSEU|nr:alpha/beta hydrolase fold domain-containing protein [Pseudonocardia xinjiangensis]NMH79397.1 alpha/beta hydrolase [Pseudonocardia xinjiangensis]
MPLPRPPFDPELEMARRTLLAGVPSSITPDMVQASRSRVAGSAVPIERLIAGRPIGVRHAEARGLATEPDVTLSVLRRHDAPQGAPVVYFMHGGGFLFGDRFSQIELVLDWIERLGVVVVTVEYRLAPENPHPAPIEDCYAGLLWTEQNAREIGGNPDFLVVAGVSGGGGLAAGLALLARDRGGPQLAGQLLMCPMLDDRNNSVSAQQFTGVGMWDQVSNATAWAALLGSEQGTDSVSPYAAPARATDLSGLPGAFVDCGSTETFRDEDVDYATRLWGAGVQAELHVWPGAFHGFDTFLPGAALSVDARRARESWLRRLITG